MGAKTLVVEQDFEKAGRVRKAVNLFTFLGGAQQLLVKPIRTVDKFEKAMWFGDLPDHAAVHSVHRISELDADAPLLAMKRVPKLDPPAVLPPLELGVDGPIDDVNHEPELRDEIYTEAAVRTVEDQDSDEVNRHRLAGHEHRWFGDEMEEGRQGGRSNCRTCR